MPRHARLYARATDCGVRGRAGGRSPRRASHAGCESRPPAPRSTGGAAPRLPRGNGGPRPRGDHVRRQPRRVECAPAGAGRVHGSCFRTNVPHSAPCAYSDSLTPSFMDWYTLSDNVLLSREEVNLDAHCRHLGQGAGDHPRGPPEEDRPQGWREGLGDIGRTRHRHPSRRPRRSRRGGVRFSEGRPLSHPRSGARTPGGSDS